MFLVYQVNDKFVIIKENKKDDGPLFKIGLTKDITKATYFINNKNANSWLTTITNAHPMAELKEAILTLKQ